MQCTLLFALLVCSSGLRTRSPDLLEQEGIDKDVELHEDIDEDVELLDENEDMRLDAELIDQTDGLSADLALMSKNLLKLHVKTGMQSPFTTPASKIGIFVHHRAGTVLTEKLAKLYAKHMNVSVADRQIGWWKRKSQHSFNPKSEEPVVHFKDPRPKDYDTFRQTFPSMRVVHFVRDPVSLVVSGWDYHRRKFNLDCIPGACWKSMSRNNITDALIQEIKAETLNKEFDQQNPLASPSNIPRMMQVYEKARDDPLALVVSYSEFEKDFDGTTRRIFAFLLGKDHKEIDSLVQLSAGLDSKRWSAARKKAASSAQRNRQGGVSHFKNDELETQAKAELQRLLVHRVPEVMELYEYRKQFVQALINQVRKKQTIDTPLQPSK